MDLYPAKSKSLSPIRADKNISEILFNELICKDAYNVMTSLLFYFFQCNQNNLFGFGVLDPYKFSKQMGFSPEFLRRRHPEPAQLKNMSKEQIGKLYQDEEKNPENRIYDSILENALFSLTQPIVFSSGAKLVTFDDGVKYMNKISTFQFLSEISCQFGKSPSGKGKDKIIYQYALNSQLINNLNHYYFHDYLEDFISIRKAGNNLDSLYLFLKNQENHESAKFNNVVRFNMDILCEKLNLSPNYSSKDKKRYLSRALDKILQHTHFKFSYNWVSAGGNARWKYVPEFTFPKKFANTNELIQFNEKEKRVMFEQSLLHQLLTLFRYLYASKSNSIEFQSYFLSWLMDNQKDYKEKSHAFDSAGISLYGKFPPTHENSRYDFFNKIQTATTLREIFPLIPSSNFDEVDSPQLMPSSEPVLLNKPIPPQNNISEKKEKTKNNCYDWLVKHGFGKTKAQSCIDNPETISLFFKWKAKHLIDNQLASGHLSSKDMKPLFYSELKKNNLRI